MQIDISKVEFSRKDIIKGTKIPTELSAELAEDVGYHIGDGYMKNITGKQGLRHGYLFCYSGHLIDDRDYIFNVLIPRKEKLFNLNKYRIDTRCGRKSLDIRFDSKAMYTFYRHSLQVQQSPKTNITVPTWVFNSNGMKTAFLRGLLDADGCLKFLKKHKNRKYYPMICYATQSKPLLEDVAHILTSLEIKYCSFEESQFDKRNGKTYTKHVININGAKRLISWMKKVGFSNSKHTNKFKMWNLLRYYPN